MALSSRAVRAGEAGGRLWQATLDALTDPVAVLGPDGRIMAVNEAWAAFAASNGGTGPWVGTSYLDVCDDAALDEPAVAEVSRNLRRILDGTCARWGWTYPCHAPGRERWFRLEAVALEGAPDRAVLLAHRDVTAAYAARRRLREQEGMAQAFDAAVVITDLAGLVTEWTPSAVEAYGWRAEERLGRPVTTFATPTAGDAALGDLVEGVVADGTWEGPVAIRRADGSQVPAYLRKRLLVDEDGTPAGVVGVATPTDSPASMQEELAESHALLADLRAAFDRRAVIEQAKGVLMAWRSIDAEAAFALLREESQRSGRKLAVLAQQVVDCQGLFGPPG